jgi:hypothetical protein
MACGLVNAKTITELTVSERAGVAREDEPVISGVPLPEGLTETTDGLAVIDEKGRRVPAQFGVASRWYPGESIKWLLIDFKASADADAETVYKLVKGGQNPEPEHPVKVKEKDGSVTVTTGRLKFKIERGRGLMSDAWLSSKGNGDYDKELLSSPVSLQMVHGGTGISINDLFTITDKSVSEIVVEERGPMRATVKMTGVLIEPGTDRKTLDFVCRLSAYAGGGRVKMDLTLECKRGQEHIAIPVDKAWVNVPLKCDMKTRTWAMGAPGGDYFGPGCDEDIYPEWNDYWAKPPRKFEQYYEPGHSEAWVQAQMSQRLVYRGEFFRKRKPYTISPKENKEAMESVGWLDMSEESHGVAASMRWFWQTWPRTLRAAGPNLMIQLHGSLNYRPGLTTRVHTPRAHYYPGMSKTTEVMLYFHGPRDIGDLKSVHAGTQKPLRAWASPSWYCEKTKAFGRLVSFDPENFDDETWKLVEQYTENFSNTIDRLVAHRDAEFGDYDSYGVFNFGDSINYVIGRRGDPGDSMVTWDNGYYDFPHAFLLHWACTGDARYFDLFEQAQQHVMDVDMVCWLKRKHLIGANRYCDGAMHIRKGRAIYISPTFNHYKNQSHYERYYLTGFRRALEMGILSSDFAVGRGPGPMGFGQPRSLGNGPLGVMSGWEATGKERFRQSWQEMIDYYVKAVKGGSKVAKGRHWQGGIGFEALREYYEETLDKEALEALKIQLERCAKLEDFAPNTLQAFAFAGVQLDRPEWVKAARSRIGKQAQIKRTWGYAKEIGNQLRNTPYVWWYLSRFSGKVTE